MAYIQSYFCHWIALLCILFLRLKAVFSVHGSEVGATPCFNRCSICAIVSAAVCGCLILVGTIGTLYLSIPYQIVTLFASLLILLLLVYSLVLGFTFVSRLFLLNRLRTSNDDDILNVMTRYVIWNSTSCMTIFPDHNPLLCTL